MQERAILHCDINHCYAQIEEMKYPDLRHIPMVVGGNEATRSGIILARNQKAKTYGIKTAETLREAFKKCPNLCVVNPNYEDYIYYSEKIKDVYREYTDKVESFGIDEAWIDLSESQKLFGPAKFIAKEIQERIRDEFGITISVGLSFNKVFAKLGSDMTKPYGFHIISKDNYQEVVWPQAVSNLLYVGKKTQKKLEFMGITTIGDLANTKLKTLRKVFGKSGETLWAFANGLETSHVSAEKQIPKSIGNGITPPRDLNNIEEIKNVLYVLIESVGARLKEQGLEGNIITLSLRDTELKTISRQKKLYQYTDLVKDIMDTAQYLIKEQSKLKPPYRSVGIKVSNLRKKGKSYQMDLFTDPKDINKSYELENTIEFLREKYGFEIIKRASVMVHEDVTSFNPKGTHTIHPLGFFK